ncbi:MAG: glycosyltransferase [Acetatifactor sp.]
MKKFFFCINTLSRAGAETALLEFMRRLAEKGYEIDLLVITGIGEMAEELPKGVRLLNREYAPVSILSEEGRRLLKKRIVRAALSRGNLFRQLPSLTVNLLGMIRKGRILPDKLLWRLLSQGADETTEVYDCAVAYIEGGATYYVADRVQAKKKAAFFHVDYGKAGYTPKLDRGCYDRFDSIYAVSDEVRDSFLRVYPQYREKTFVFHNLLNREGILRKARCAGGFSDDYSGKRILTIGRLTAQKCLEVSIRAMKLLAEQGVEARWYVLGEGDQRDKLERLIAASQLEERFYLLGAVDNPYPYLQQADLYVHASGFEGKSIAIQEAQILGKAILVSDCNGNREQVVSGADGEICPLSAEAVIAAIRRMLSDEELCRRYGQAAALKMAEDSSGQEALSMFLKRNME